MAKRRTRKQKEKAKHRLTVSWEPSTPSLKKVRKTASKKGGVKGQKKNTSQAMKKNLRKTKKANSMAKGESLSLIKRDIVKSLIIASLILSLEVVIYLTY